MWLFYLIQYLLTTRRHMRGGWQNGVNCLTYKSVYKREYSWVNIQYSKDFSIQGRDYIKSTFRINHPFMTQGTETFTSDHIFIWLYRMWWWIFRIRMKDTTDICLKIATLRKCNVTDVTLLGLLGSWTESCWLRLRSLEITMNLLLLSFNTFITPDKNWRQLLWLICRG